MKELKFKNKELVIDNKSYELKYTIRDARIIENKAVVIFKFDETVPKYRQFNNCQAFNENGKLIWVAEHPTNSSADHYVEFMNKKNNLLWNFDCFICQLDFETGKLKEAKFTK